MARKPETTPVLTIGLEDEESAAHFGGFAGVLLVFGALVFALLAFGPPPPSNEETPPEVAPNRLDSSLLHDLGGPVDAVEQFMAALSYGQSGVVAGSIASDADLIELPFLPTSPRQIRSTMATLEDIDASIQMFGCTAADAAAPSPVAVTCSVAYNSDFVRDLGAHYLRGTMAFLVADGQIARVTVDLESPLAGGVSVEEAFDRWLVDFYSESLRSG